LITANELGVRQDSQRQANIELGFSKRRERVWQPFNADAGRHRFDFSSTESFASLVN